MSHSSCFFWSVIENMPKMCIRARRASLGTSHKKLRICLCLYKSSIYRFTETWPTCSRIKFITRTIQRSPIDDIDIDSIFMVVPVLIFEWFFCGIFLSYFILERSESALEFLLRIGFLTELCDTIFPVFFDKSFSSTSCCILLISRRCFFIIVLVIFFCIIELRCRKYERCDCSVKLS